MTTSNTEKQPFAEDREWKNLFSELCRAHQLSWRQKWLLKNVSKLLEVKPAARLFIEPDWFTTASKTKELQHRRGQLVELCQRLFQRKRQQAAR